MHDTLLARFRDCWKQRVGSGVFLAACLSTIASAASSAAEQVNEIQPRGSIVFDIPTQPLETALDAYGSVSGVQVLYQSSLTAGHRSSKVQGVLTPESALRTLLVGTGLAVRYTTDDSYTLVPQPVQAPQVGTTYVPPDMTKYGYFLGEAQAGVLGVLCRDPETRPGNYRTTIKFWIDSSGAVLKTALLASTGNPARDAAILDALDRMTIGDAPAAEMPQPVTMVVAARPPSVTGDCAAEP